jgi:hypothetical protein
MAIQTQGFQFQNLARYTPVDPTLVGVDFSRIGSGIADAMKLGSSLQQYQMRKQAMEEEQATRESRIAQANAAAKYLAAQANAQLAADIATKEAAAKAARFESEVPVAQLTGATAKGELGLVQPSIDAKRARLLAEKASAETATMFVDQERALRAADLASQLSLVPSKANIAQLTAKRQEEELKYATEGADARERAYKEWKQQFDMATTGLSLSEQESRVLKNLADAKESIARSTSTKPTNYIPALNSVSSQIKQIRTTPITVGGVPYNIQTYIDEFGEPPPAGQKGEPKKGYIFNTPRSEQADNTVRLLRLLEREQLGLLQATSVFSPLRLDGVGGGGGGGGMAVNVPTLGGQAQAGAPYLDNLSARIQQALAERLGGGATQVAQGAQVSQVPAISPPVLDDLINASVTTPTEGVVTTPTAAPAAAQGPAATMEIKDGKVVPVKSVMERAEGATQKAIEFAKDKPASAILAAAAAKKVIPPAVKLSGSALNTLLSYTPQAIAVARTLANRATPVLAANEILGSFIRTDEKPSEETGLEIAGFKTKFGAGSAVPRIARLIAQSIYEPEGSKQIQDEIERIGEEIKSIAKSNLTATEKLSQIGPLREQQANLIQQITPRNDSTSIPSVPSASGGRALIFPGITSIRPGSDAPELTGPLTESNRTISDANTLASESENNDKKLTDFIKEYVRSVPSDSGGSALIFPKITSTAPKGKTKSTETAKELDEKELTEFLRKLFYGKNLEERINDILVREELKKTGGYNFGR